MQRSVFLVDDAEALAEHGHVLGGLAVDGGEGAGEESPVGFAPVLAGAVAFAFVIGELGIDLVEGFVDHFESLEDAAGGVGAVADDGEGALGERCFVLGFPLPQARAACGLGACEDEVEEFVGQLGGVAKGICDDGARCKIGIVERVGSDEAGDELLDLL